LLAVKLVEMGRVTTGMAARLAGVDRVSFMFELDRFGLSPLGVDARELEQDMAKA
jgi:predicted HTH domain antitoxin